MTICCRVYSRVVRRRLIWWSYASTATGATRATRASTASACTASCRPSTAPTTSPSARSHHRFLRPPHSGHAILRCTTNNLIKTEQGQQQLTSALRTDSRVGLLWHSDTSGFVQQYCILHCFLVLFDYVLVKCLLNVLYINSYISSKTAEFSNFLYNLTV